MRIAIVDDQAKDRALIRQQLQEQFFQRDIRADLFEFDRAESFLQAAQSNPFTIAFLDIYMEGLGGMEAARTLRQTDRNCLIVFVTTSTDHALEGFQVRAFHYLVKPFAKTDMTQLIEELLDHAGQTDPCLQLKAGGSQIRVRYSDIVFAEHFAHLIYVHTTIQKTLTTRQSFRTFIEPLKKDPRFFVCGRGTIVNLSHVLDIEEAAFCMDDGNHVFISKDLLKRAKQAFMEYLLEGSRFHG